MKRRCVDCQWGSYDREGFYCEEDGYYKVNPEHSSCKKFKPRIKGEEEKMRKKKWLEEAIARSRRIWELAGSFTDTCDICERKRQKVYIYKLGVNTIIICRRCRDNVAKLFNIEFYYE